MSQPDPTCPRCRGPMKLRNSSFGPFWSCARFPTCRGKIDVEGKKPQENAPPAKPPPLGPTAEARPVGVHPPDFGRLDDHQREVVEYVRGVGVVAASAGSGKTHVLIQRTLYLLHLGELPESICLLAYNKDAAQTLRDRLAQFAPHAAARVQIFTFHSWCYAVLRHWYPNDPRYGHTRILGGAGSKHPIELARVAARKVTEKDDEDDSAWGLLAAADRIAENMVRLDVENTPAEIVRVMGWWTEETPVPKVLPPQLLHKAKIQARFCQEWATIKATEGYIDFTDMVCTVAWWIRSAPDQPHVHWLTQLYRHVMVDECQDINPARHTIATHIGCTAISAVFVGDMRQSLYSFVGAQPDLFQDMATAEGTRLFTLPVNRRSTSEIVDAANAIARDQSWNLGGDARSLTSNGRGEPIQVVTQMTPKDEAVWIIEDIQTRIRRGLPLDTTGENYRIVARTNAMLIDMEYVFVARGVPCRVLGAPGGIWGTTIGQEMLNYLEAIEGIPTWGLLKLANKPKRYAKKDDVRTVILNAQEAEKAGQAADLHGRLRMHLSAGLRRLGTEMASTARRPWGSRCLEVARWLGMEDEKSMEGGDTDRADALRALLHHAQSLGSLRGIQDYRDALAKQERAPAVLLSTIHAAKGQEARVVYVAGVRTDKLPHKKGESVDEERRIFYVAVTRAREACVITTGGTPSRFLRELSWIDDIPKWETEAASTPEEG